MDKVLSNTTPLIALADIDQLDLLHKLYNDGAVCDNNRN